ncbi:conserved Plasmodium protein, unknown function [Plasmodium knowlesi strain H]|uniref:Uncharacterized protein n=3 Tax=Plasmodium knowlesi TaxID=5850 RepID=A0A5K1VPK0_PLAKH|nr:conserved Plasmodium protein, unknown function [Plasmodium knowlesi strain H]OTN65669.1 Uncharacterized protein PKNOH_S110090800 [Plasmodium knowlesi]CAA9989527.1 conserved Plasmodium protein, unknown function [Plasmodium knowlesi strain H]SBO22521.1 conserved Plasmodium protein, unknown function [Plasmodium knowlesi strain H]SBO23629.1 conserved Plasmodium protein, unknown function [Plasmodium knowlesi strain H]VVS79001.1 conserved Plasmodium protein, unknown function [Plasmodium knowlesi |eukprot:XP_002260252.1 hypothetical protein, conserved in Plasmodium species [Plasmodium knowlesi strain H]
MINEGNIKNEMEQFCKFFHQDNNNSFLCNDYCEYMNNFFASEDQMYFGAKYHFDSFDKFTNFPVHTPICKLSNFKKIKREYFAKGKKNRYWKNPLFKRIIKNHLDYIEKYVCKLGTRPSAQFAKFRERGRRGKNGFPSNSKIVLRKYFNIGVENTRRGKNSPKRGNVLNRKYNGGQKQSLRKVSPEKKILHGDPQMSIDEKGKFLKRINLHFIHSERSGIDILFSPDDAKGLSRLFLLRKRQTDHLEEERDDKSTKSEDIYRNAQFVPHEKRVQILSYDDMEFYKLMRKRLRDKCKNEVSFSRIGCSTDTSYAKKKVIKVLSPRGKCIGGKTDDKQEGDQIETKGYMFLSLEHVKTNLERNKDTQNDNDQLFVNLGSVKYKCLNKYHSLLDYQNEFAQSFGENNKIGMTKPYLPGAEGETTEWCFPIDSDVSFSNFLQKNCGWYFTEGKTPNGMNSSQMGHSNGKENVNKFYITSSTTCTSASKSEANHIDDEICNDEGKDASVSSEKFKNIYEEGNNNHTNDIQDVGTHFLVNNMVQVLPMGKSEEGGICYQSKLSEKFSKLNFKNAQVGEDKCSVYDNERLCSVAWDNQCGCSSNLGDRNECFPHGEVLSPCGVPLHDPEGSYATITNSQCNYGPLGSVLKKPENEEENKRENYPREGRCTLEDKIPSDTLEQVKHSCKNGEIRGRTIPIILETPQLENKQKFALKPKVYWSKRRPFWEEKKRKGIRNRRNTNYHQYRKFSLKNVEDDNAHSKKDVLSFKGGVHIGCEFTKGKKQVLMNFPLTTYSTCTLRSTPLLHKRALTNEPFFPLERRIIHSSGNIQKKSYTISCINEISILRNRKKLSVNILSLDDGNQYDRMGSRSEQFCVGSSKMPYIRLSSNCDRVSDPRRGEPDTEAVRTSHSYDVTPLKDDTLLLTIVQKESPMENGSNEKYSKKNENKKMLKCIYTKGLVDKKKEPFTNTEGTTYWEKDYGMIPPMNDNSLYENLLTRCESPCGFFPTSNDSKGEELPMCHRKTITQNADKMNREFSCKYAEGDTENKDDASKVNYFHKNDLLPKEGKLKILSSSSDNKVINQNVPSGNILSQNKRSMKKRNKSEINSTTARIDNQQINHSNDMDRRNINCESVWANHLKGDSFTHSIYPNGQPSQATEQNLSSTENTHLRNQSTNSNLDMGGNYNIGALSKNERGGRGNRVTISVGNLNEKFQFGKICQDDSAPSEQKESCCYPDGKLDSSRKEKDQPSTREQCICLADLDEINKKTHCVEGGTGRKEKEGNYNQVERLKMGRKNDSGFGAKKIEAVNKSDYHLEGEIDKDKFSSRTNFPIDFFNINEKRETKNVISNIGKKNLSTPQHIQNFEYPFANANNCEAIPALDHVHCDGELPNRLRNASPEHEKENINESFTKKSQNGYLIEWYPGFDIPIGTYGRAILRKALHQKRMTDVKKCDELLSSNGLFPTSRSTFGDMKIRDLYRAAHILGIWNVAEKYCLLACERNGYKREWIDMLKRNGVKITIKALKELRSKYLLTSKNFSISGKKKKNNNNHAKESDNHGMDTNKAARTEFERCVVQPGGSMLEPSSTILRKASHSHNCLHDDKAGSTRRDCFHNTKCKKENKSGYQIDERKSYLSTVESIKTDKKRTSNRLHCTVPKYSSPAIHMHGSNEAILDELKKNRVLITNDEVYPSGSDGVGKTDFINTHKDRLPSTPQMINTNVVDYTPTPHMSVGSTSTSLSKIQFGYSTQDVFSNMVVGPVIGTMTDDFEMSNEISMENSNQIQNTCHFFDENILHERRELIHPNWNPSGMASLLNNAHTVGTTITGDNELHSAYIPLMGDFPTYECMRNEHPLNMGIRSDLFHTGGTSDSFQFWNNAQSGTYFLHEYM